MMLIDRREHQPEDERGEEEYLEVQIRKSRGRMGICVVTLAIFATIAVLSGASRVFDRDVLQAHAAELGFPVGFWFFMALFLAGELAMVIPAVPPLLTVVATLTYGPILGGIIASVGSISVAMLTYSVTRLMGGDPRIIGTVRRGSRLDQALTLVREYPILTVSGIRILPLVGQYPLTNMALALAGVPFLGYTLGTAPIIIAIAFSTAWATEMAMGFLDIS